MILFFQSLSSGLWSRVTCFRWSLFTSSTRLSPTFAICTVPWTIKQAAAHDPLLQTSRPLQATLVNFYSSLAKVCLNASSGLQAAFFKEQKICTKLSRKKAEHFEPPCPSNTANRLSFFLASSLLLGSTLLFSLMARASSLPLRLFCLRSGWTRQVSSLQGLLPWQLSAQLFRVQFLTGIQSRSGSSDTRLAMFLASSAYWIVIFELWYGFLSVYGESPSFTQSVGPPLPLEKKGLQFRLMFYSLKSEGVLGLQRWWLGQPLRPSGGSTELGCPFHMTEFKIAAPGALAKWSSLSLFFYLFAEIKLLIYQFGTPMARQGRLRSSIGFLTVAGVSKVVEDFSATVSCLILL